MEASALTLESSATGQRQSTMQETGEGLVLLSGSDLRTLLTPKTVIEALHQAYRELAASHTDQGKSLAFAIEGGSAHVKAGVLPGSRAVLAAKVNVNLPNNWKMRRLPTIQGALLLVDTITGSPLALMDSIALTGIRTAATAMLAASFGARKDSKIAAIIGCGVQAHYQVEALRACFPIEEIRIFDIDEARAQSFAAVIGDDAIQVRTMATVAETVARTDICITCTTSTQAILTPDMDLAGCFVAAIGADNPQKSEIGPALMARARIFVDDLEQCTVSADLAHALRAGSLTRDGVHADLAELTAGQKAGRDNANELVIFDSCGSGLQDVAAAWAAYQNAHAKGVGARFNLAGQSKIVS
jgi:ornithine cyclodeaminase/alanine dehydrogenase-like protein (mu-crystallin family)